SIRNAEGKSRPTAWQTFTSVWTVIADIWPMILGLTFARSGLIAACYGFYRYTDEGIYTDGAMLISLIIMAVILTVLAPMKTTLSDRTHKRIAVVCIALEGTAIITLGLINLMEKLSVPLHFSISVWATLVASGAMFYWLRLARGFKCTTVCIYVFSTLILSEALLYIGALLPRPFDCFFAGILSFIQLPMIALVSKKDVLPSGDESEATGADGMFSVFNNLIRQKQTLIFSALGISLLSAVIGILRGYPNGDAIAFGHLTRLVCALFIIILSLGILFVFIRGHHMVMASGVFILMEALGTFALLSYAAFPTMLDIGAVFTTAMNAIMVGYAYFIIIEFMTHGWRDTYYYAISGWIAWLGARALARMVMLKIVPDNSSNILTVTVICAMIILSTQIILVLFAKTEHDYALSFENRDVRTKATKLETSQLARLMGIDSGENRPEVDLTQMRMKAMKNSAEIVGEHFLLSKREIEVLALYAMGLTQKKVAEMLFITPDTAHAHIKRIYSKTDMHSRQELIDYIEQYAS
ncbi:MAG: helix-turn-helix transcriptional regulator, partial [Eggerthellaceae bacterium]|nr:helix-turn-helix transcriptional regulator [Eggerthellaceae bacterium]